jgi:hypothetical protein
MLAHRNSEKGMRANYSYFGLRIAIILFRAKLPKL